MALHLHREFSRWSSRNLGHQPFRWSGGVRRSHWTDVAHAQRQRSRSLTTPLRYGFGMSRGGRAMLWLRSCRCLLKADSPKVKVYGLCGRNMRSNQGFQVLPLSLETNAVSRTPPSTGFQMPRTRFGSAELASSPVITIWSDSRTPSITSNSPRLVTQVWCQTLR